MRRDVVLPQRSQGDVRFKSEAVRKNKTKVISTPGETPELYHHNPLNKRLMTILLKKNIKSLMTNVEGGFVGG